MKKYIRGNVLRDEPRITYINEDKMKIFLYKGEKLTLEELIKRVKL